MKERTWTWIFIALAVAGVVLAMRRDWAAVAAVAALAAAIVAIYQASLTRMTLGADLMMKLEDRFEDPEFCAKRQKAAKALRAISPANRGDVEEVLDFFETLGLLVRREALDAEFAWSSFFYWLHGYHRWAESFIKDQQNISPNRYYELVSLHEKMLPIEQRKGRIKETEWDAFLEEEAGFQAGRNTQNRTLGTSGTLPEGSRSLHQVIGVQLLDQLHHQVHSLLSLLVRSAKGSNVLYAGPQCWN
jgi:hypothetical protein